MDDYQRAEIFKTNFFWDCFKALEFNGISGDYAEFGCHGARTFRYAYDQIKSRPKIARHLWAFDSFQGLPPPESEKDFHPVWKPGAMQTSLPQFEATLAEHGVDPSAYTTIEGYFSHSLFQSDTAYPSDIALAYIDCDLYSSTRDALRFLQDKLKPGMIIAFDDFFCWSNDGISGEKAAFEEFEAAQTRWRFHRYRDYGWAGCSYVVEPVSPD